MFGRVFPEDIPWEEADSDIGRRDAENVGRQPIFREKESMQLSLYTIAGLEKAYGVRDVIYVVENPSVYGVLAAEADGRYALLCLNGQSNLASILFLDLLMAPDTVGADEKSCPQSYPPAQSNENKTLEKDEIRKLNVSICSMHSLIQETANFLPLGANIGILILPRFITAILSVWLYRLISGVTRRITAYK